MHKHGKVDLNQTEIVKALRLVGATVVSLASVGEGVPDLLVGYKGHNYLMEVKGPKGKLTPDQLLFHDGYQGTIYLVRSIEEAYQTIGVIT